MRHSLRRRIRRNHHLLVRFGIAFAVFFAVLILVNSWHMYLSARIQAIEDEYENAFEASRSIAEYMGEHFDEPELYPQEFEKRCENLKITLMGPMFVKYDEKTGDYIIGINPDSRLPLKAGDKIVIMNERVLDLTYVDKEDLKGYRNNLVVYSIDGKWLSGMLYNSVAYPVVDDAGNFLGFTLTTVDDTMYYKKNYNLATAVSRLNMILTILVGVIMLLIIYLRVLRPISALGKGLKQYTKDMDTDQLTVRMDNIKSKNEIGRLADDISDMALKIKQYSEENTEMVRKQTRITSELDMAANIQSAALPVNFPDPETEKRYMIYASMNPAKQVGGDFYDFFLIDDDHIALVIADVSDKGVPAALFMMNAKTLIHSRIKSGDGPAEAIHNTNQLLCENNKNLMFVTVWLAVVEISTGKGLAVNAGHENPYIFHSAESQWELVKNKHNAGLGVSKRARYTENEFTLKPGDAVYVYTDGVTDAKNENNELFGEARLTELMGRFVDFEPEQLLNDISESLRYYSGEADQFDDITMLCFKLGI